MDTERQVMQEYLDALVKRADFPSYFTEDVVATFEGTDQRADGREAAGQPIRYVHEGAFDARMELKNLLADDATAIEADFVGTHTAEFAGIQPRAGQSGSPTRWSTTCAVIRSARCASTSRSACSSNSSELSRPAVPPGHARARSRTTLISRARSGHESMRAQRRSPWPG